MNSKVILAAAVLTMGGLGACAAKSTTTGPATTTSAPSPRSSSLPPLTGPTGGTASSSTTTSGPLLAGQPGATATSGLGFVAGYQETVVEAAGHRFVHSYQPTLDTPGTQVHCPAVWASVGATFVCQVDANATLSVFEPLKVDGLNPLQLEFAVIDRANFVCSAHASWVVKAMANAGSPCSGSSTGGGQGG